MTRLPKLVLAVGLVASACSSDTTPTTTTPAEVSTTATVSGDTRLVVLDENGDVVVMERDGSNRMPVAEVGESNQAYGQPIWSPDGERISYARANPDGFSYVVHDLADGSSNETTLSQFPFYAYWSPSTDHVGVLRNGEVGVTLEIVDTVTGELTEIGAATPYYFDWSPDGSEIVGHAGPDRLVRQTPTGETGRDSGTSADYLAPNWLDQGILHMEGEEIVIVSGDGEVGPVVNVSGPAFFVANPQGDLIATQALSSDPAVTVALEEIPTSTPNTVSVVNLDDGSLTVAFDDPALGFFWSPDGQRLLILAPDEGGSTLGAHVWEAGETSRYLSYVPHPAQVRDVFPFFPQYALSMSYWSADSSSFVLIGGIDDEAGVWVQDLDQSAPVLVSEGSWATWSP